MHARVLLKTRCPRTMVIAQVLYATTGCNDKVAQAYARQKRVRAICANPWLDEGFGTACAGIDEAQRQVLLHPATPASIRAVAAARQYLLEHGLVQWVAHHNLTKGIAVGAARLGDPLGATGLDNGEA